MKIIICEYHPYDSITHIGNHHYAREFLRAGWDVLWISHPVSPMHGMKSSNDERVKRAKSGPFRHPDSVTEIIPYTFLPFYNAPIFNSRWTLQNCNRFISPSLESQLKKVGFDQPDLLWITDTSLQCLADIIPAKKLAIRIADDNTKFANMPASLIWAEERLCEKADAVFVTSYPLLEKLEKRYGSKLHLLRNGVDFDHFQGEFQKPDEYGDIKGPIAIYVGAIEEWFDIGEVLALAKSRPDLTVVLIGRATIDLAALNASNIRFLGPRPYATLPAFLSHADLGIIPFKRTPLIESVSPLKLFEFFASGLPVVSTKWKELEHLESPAMLASDSDEFIKMSSRAIDDRWKASRGAEYKAYAKANSWESRFASLRTAIAL